MREEENDKKSALITEIVIMIVFLLLACSGIAHTIVRRTHKGTGTFSLDDYTKYCTVTVVCDIGLFPHDGQVSGKCGVAIRAEHNFILTDVHIEYRLESTRADLGDASAVFETVTASDTKQKTYVATFHLTDIYEAMSHQIDITVLSISGTYRYIWGEG